MVISNLNLSNLERPSNEVVMGSAMAIVGSLAPEFALPCTSMAEPQRRQARFLDYRGQWLTLVFYPRDFSLVCPTELTALSTRYEEFQRHGCAILGISTDSVESHERWLRTPRGQGGLGGLNFPLASDGDGSVCRAYGVHVPYQNIAMRGLFIIDPNGVLQYQVVHNLSVGRRTEEILRVLLALQTGGLCSEDWSPARATLDPTRTLGPGSMLSRYRIEELLGTGSFGSVYRAHDTTLQRLVAVKVFKPDDQAATLAALNEARAAAALNHPNVCTIFAIETSEGVPMIVMEFVAGRPLSKLLEAGSFSRSTVALLGAQIARGLEAAHARGIVHGDLKPANVMVTSDQRIKLMDFGLARLDSRLTRVEDTVVYVDGEPPGISGTPSYMSPEQADGKPVTASSDIFSFGLVLYEMLTGRRAIAGDNVLSVLQRIRALDPIPLAEQTTEPFSQLLRHALAPGANARLLNMSQIADQLESII